LLARADCKSASHFVSLPALDATLFVVAWLNFEQRDFKT
jgi:hypothetical protein